MRQARSRIWAETLDENTGYLARRLRAGTQSGTILDVRRAAGEAGQGCRFENLFVSCVLGALLRKRQPPRTLGYPRFNVDRRVKVSGFLPKRFRFLGLAGIELENRQSANGVGQIQRRSSLITAVDTQGLVITGLGQPSASLMPVNVAYMPNRMSQFESVARRDKWRPLLRNAREQRRRGSGRARSGPDW
jgi:hypothetical protein